jgi:hypothetical protein
MSLTEEEYEAIEDLAACNYSPVRISKYLDVDKAKFLSAWYNKESEVRLRYDKGQLQAEFIIAQKRLENAKNGNLTADQQHTKEVERRKTEDIKHQILFGGFLNKMAD